MVIAPAALFGAIFFWVYGMPVSGVAAVDRFILNVFEWVAGVGTAIVNAISR